MASERGGIIQDQNFNVHYKGSVAGKATAMNSQRKGGLSGRKPLGDLSNSGRPNLNQATKKQTAMKFSPAEVETGACKSKASEKVQASGRKALTDISNSGKLNMPEASKKKQNMKLSAVAEEGFLHDHNKCIEAQNHAMDMEEFMKTIGLSNDICREFPSPSKAESPRRDFKLEEMAEQPFLYRSSASEVPGKLDSSHACLTPKSPDHHPLWNELPSINFKLIESPEPLKY